MGKKFTIEINTKPTWKVSRGHADRRAGAGKHDNRPRKLGKHKLIKQLGIFPKKGLTVCRYIIY